jgi:tRNA(Arg) A34 adenosine deaminase TadA
MRLVQSFSLSLPEWLGSVAPKAEEAFRSTDERMRLAIQFARLNVQNRTGGPFGAAVFNEETGTFLSAGVNLVIRSELSIAHAEIVAISLAQRALETYELAGPGLPRLQLVSSAEPCVMCFGAVTWSGIRSLVCGARDEDVRAIGFDEGAKTPDWTDALASRGISVYRDVCRSEAVGVLQAYQSAGGPIYNGTRGS